MVYWPNFFRSLLFTSKVNLHSKGLSKFAQKVTEVVSTKATYKCTKPPKSKPFPAPQPLPTLYYVPYHPINKCRKRQNTVSTYKFLNFPSPKFMILAVEELKKALGTPYWVDKQEQPHDRSFPYNSALKSAWNDDGLSSHDQR